MEDCIFCKIVRGELPAIKVYEDEDTLAFLTTQPTTKGHTLVIPKEHARNIFDISSLSWSRTQETLKKVAKAIEEGLKPDGLNIQMNNREHAGQSVHHAHLHLIPRYKGDGLSLWPMHKRRDEEGEPVAKQIREAL